MPIQQITPDQAKEALDKDPDAVYLDVRSIPEFTEGHAAKAVNIPLLHSHPATGQMSPNPDFLSVVTAILPKGKKLFVGCKMGGRSQRACELLAQSGYEDVFNIDGGFGGMIINQGGKIWAFRSVRRMETALAMSLSLRK